MKTIGRFIASLAALSPSLGGAQAERLQAKDPAAAKAFVQELVEPTPLAPAVETQLRKLIADLGSDQWKVRQSASKALVEIGTRAEPLVVEALDSNDVETRTRAKALLEAYRAARENRPAQLSRAVDLLAEAKDKLAVEALVKLLTHPDAGLRHAAEYGLRRLTGERFGYNAHADEAERNAAAERWRAWWRASRRSFRFEAVGQQCQIAGILLCEYSSREVSVLSLTGEILWSRKFARRPYSVDAVPNGNVLISFYEDGTSVVEEQTRSGKVVWSTEALELAGPLEAVQRLPNGNTLAADRRGRRIIEIDAKGRKIAWQYACPGPSCASASAERLPNGNTLVCVYIGMLVEVNRAGEAVWTYDRPTVSRDARKLPNGNVLLAEYGRNRVVEIRPDGGEVLVWTDPHSRPVSACRLPDGRTVIQAVPKGLLLVDPSRKTVKTLWDRRPHSYQKLRLAPAVFRPMQGQQKKESLPGR